MCALTCARSACCVTQRAVISERRACFGMANTLSKHPGPQCWAGHTYSPAAVRAQEDNQEELQRVLGVEFAKDDEEEEEEHTGAFTALLVGFA